MNTKRFLALLMTLAISLSIFAIPATAAEEEACTHDHEEVEIIFVDESISDELKAKATAYLLCDEAESDDAATYGLTCTLFGHKLETTQAYKITHKARSTAPRCLKRLYKYETCTRCDYQTSTVLSSTYIYCCA